MKFKLTLASLVVATFLFVAYTTCSDKKNDVLCKMAMDGAFESKSDMNLMKDGDNSLVIIAACDLYPSRSHASTPMLIR